MCLGSTLIDEISNDVYFNFRAGEFTGISEFRAKTEAQARKNDLIVMYVPSPYCTFADVRRVMQDGLARSAHTRKYETPCSSGLVTTPIQALDIKRWVPIRLLIGKLSFIKPSKRWGYALRNSFRTLTTNDAIFIVNAMVVAKPGPEWTRTLNDLNAARALADKMKPKLDSNVRITPS